jgi:hypothetical protein
MSAALQQSDAPAAPPAEAPDPFLEAFDRLSGLGEDAPPAAVAAAATGEPAPAPETVAGAEGADTVAAAEPAEGADTIAAEPDPEPEPAPADKDAEDDALLQRLSDLVRKKAPEPAPAAPAAPAAEEVPIYTAEEQALLETYKKEWPDVAKAEALARRAEHRQVVEFVFKEVATYLKPYIEQLEAVATRTHLADLQSKVGDDYDDVRDKVIDWVGKQPKYLQTAYGHVINEGTADEVADLVSRWRAETGTPAAKPTPSQPRQKETALPPAAKQAAAALAPVGSKRSAPSAGLDPADFGGAFEMFAAGKV